MRGVTTEIAPFTMAVTVRVWERVTGISTRTGAQITARIMRGQVAAATYGAQPKGYPTRYQVYRWEADQMVAGTLPNSAISKNVGGSSYTYAQPQAGRSLALPNSPYGKVPGVEMDRRRLSVAVLNCNALTALHGNSINNTVSTWGHGSMCSWSSPPKPASVARAGAVAT